MQCNRIIKVIEIMEGINKIITTINTVNSNNNVTAGNKNEELLINNNSANVVELTSAEEEQALNMIAEETEKSTSTQKARTSKRIYDEKTGLTTIKIYSNEEEGSKPDSTRKCYITKTNSNEAKYIFASGQKNNIHIVDNGDSIHVKT